LGTKWSKKIREKKAIPYMARSKKMFSLSLPLKNRNRSGRIRYEYVTTLSKSFPIIGFVPKIEKLYLD
jgi:hypothetical protein